MQFGVDVPIKGEYFDPRILAELAHVAEEAGKRRDGTASFRSFVTMTI